MTACACCEVAFHSGLWDAIKTHERRDGRIQSRIVAELPYERKAANRVRHPGITDKPVAISCFFPVMPAGMVAMDRMTGRARSW